MFAGAPRGSHKPPLPLQPASPFPYRILRSGTKAVPLVASLVRRAISSTFHPRAASPAPLAPVRLSQPLGQSIVRSALLRPHALLVPHLGSSHPRAHAALRPSPRTRPRSILLSLDAALLASPLTGARSALPRPLASIPASP